MTQMPTSVTYAVSTASVSCRRPRRATSWVGPIPIRSSATVASPTDEITKNATNVGPSSSVTKDRAIVERTASSRGVASAGASG